MRIREIEAREDFEAGLIGTLLPELARRAGQPVSVVRGASQQRWLQSDLLSAIFVEGVGKSARRFMRQNFEHTPFLARRLPQFVLAQAVCRTPLLERSAKVAFEIDCAVPSASDMLVIPGNRRIRIFDFALGRTRTCLKATCSAQGNLREIEVRAHSTGPFVPLLDFDADGRWLEEPIVDGVPLPRLAPWARIKEARDSALQVLFEWQQARTEELAGAEYASSLGERCHALMSRSKTLVGSLRVQLVVDRLAALGARKEVVQLTRSHGDLQPGNILVSGKSGTVIDWEYSKTRMVEYDPLVFFLGTRTNVRAHLGRDLADPVRKALTRTPWAPTTKDTQPVVALFLLNELIWRLEDAEEGGFDGVSKGLTDVVELVSDFSGRTGRFGLDAGSGH